jgi:Spy/CpxP family protein refolding chaperone
MKSKLFVATLMAALVAAPAFAQDDTAKKKRKKGQAGAQQNVAMQTIKQLEDAKLTDEQIAKIKELGKTANAKLVALRDEAGITPALLKKRADAQKSLKDSGKKGKELQAAINEAAGLTEAQSAAFAKVNEARTAFQKQVIALLTDEQKENLPQALKRVANAKGGNAKGKKRKQAN